MPAGPLNERHRSADGAAGGKNVVKHENARTFWKSIRAHLESRLAVFQCVALGERDTRQLALFANGQHPHARVDGRGGSEQKAARFESGNRIKSANEWRDHGVDNHTEGGAVGKHRREVPKEHSRQGKVGHGLESFSNEV